jgi:hypothetical protein
LIGPAKRAFTDKDYAIYLSSQEVLFEIMKRQLWHFHPNAHIHVLTNIKDCKNESNLTFHYRDFKSNHICKFLLYNLIPEPAIYLDCDIVLFSEFNKYHLETKERFNLFSVSRHLDLQRISRTSLPVEVNTLLNAGVIYIKSPSADITEALLSLNDKFFSDSDYIISKNEWPYNDEYALSLYVKMNNMNMNLHPGVNVLRWFVQDIENKNIQSLHYTGVKAKSQLSFECKKFPVFHSIMQEFGSSLARRLTLL